MRMTFIIDTRNMELIMLIQCICQIFPIRYGESIRYFSPFQTGLESILFFRADSLQWGERIAHQHYFDIVSRRSVRVYTDNLYRQIWFSFSLDSRIRFLIQIANAYEYFALFSPFILQCTRMTNFFLRFCLDAFGSANSKRSMSRMWLGA